MKIAIVGYGNLGWNLERQLRISGLEVSQIQSNLHSGSAVIDKLEKLDGNTKLVFVCKSDAAISNTVEALNQSQLTNSCIVAHTSGSIPIQNSRFQDAVFYPFQTFTREYTANWKNVPVFIETESEKVKSTLSDIVYKIGCNVHELNSNQRKALHIAGVFSSNFPNHLIRLIFDYLSSNQLNHELIKPLLLEGIRKSLDLGPAKAQTGPAIRGDETVIKQHLELLKSNPELHDLYAIFTKGIQSAKQ